MKHDRIEMRTTQNERDRLLEAALYSGLSLSAFLRQSALEKSDEILKHKDALTLSNRDRDLFLNALENPPRPNKRLQQAFNKYQKLKRGVKTPIRKPKSRTPKIKTS